MTLEASRRGIFLFAARVLVLGVVLFAAWYALARPVSLASGWLAARALAAAAPVDEVRVLYAGRRLTFRAWPDDATRRRDRVPAQAVVEVPEDALQYAYGIPFFLALLLATRPSRWGWKALGGSAVMTGVAGFGLFCEAYLDLSVARNPWSQPFFDLPRAALEAAALGYQLASLVLPTVVAAVLWAAFDPASLRALRRG